MITDEQAYEVCWAAADAEGNVVIPFETLKALWYDYKRLLIKGRDELERLQAVEVEAIRARPNSCNG